MHHLPSYKDFASTSDRATLRPVYRKLYSDTLTPVTAFCKAGWTEQSFLFESVVGGEKVGRYSFLGGDPFFRIEAYGNDVEFTVDGKVERKTVDDPLETLGELIAQYPSEDHSDLPPFVGGAVGYAGYDVIRYTEHLPDPPEDDRNVPDMSFALYRTMVIFDHIEKTTIVVSHAFTDADDPRAEYDAACERIDQLCERLQAPQTVLEMPDVVSTEGREIAWKSNFSREEYCEAVDACKEYIRAGDIFQVVLSQRFELETTVTPLEIYRSLRVVNPSPFMFLLHTPKTTLVGSSPEIMVRVEDGETTIRPLAGTRKRGETETQDLELAEDLLSDPKERAEHVMLVDLARNDVGRIAQYGTVQLSDVMVVERYSHVMHITSNVKGQLRDGLTCLDALRAGLPAGTVSGAPKVRAMEIIDEFERNRRGPYAGAVGYIDFTGNMDTCIALRTIVVSNGKIYVQAGAGIVADSVPEMEYEETLNKARGLLKAIALAEAVSESGS